MNDQTIELKTFRVNQTNDANTSRLPLIKKEDTKKISNVQRKIEKQFATLYSITNIDKFMYFIYVCLFFDFSYCIFHGYELISCLTDITKMKLIYIVIIQYAFSLYNGVLYFKIIIYNRDLVNEIEKKKEQDKDPQSGKKNEEIKIESELDMRCEIKLNLPLQEIKSVFIFRVITWLFKYLGYIFIIYLNSNLESYEYCNILIFLTDYYFIVNMQFYYKVMLRIEAFKKLYGFKDIES